VTGAAVDPVSVFETGASSGAILEETWSDGRTALVGER